MEVLSRLGARLHIKPSKRDYTLARLYPSERWRLSQTIPWLGFEVDARAMRVRLTSEGAEKGEAWCFR